MPDGNPAAPSTAGKYRGESAKSTRQRTQTLPSPDLGALQKSQVVVCYRAICKLCTSNLDAANPDASYCYTGRLVFSG
jgi:hypothetical protein